jgi:hypothetical protein
MSDNVEFPVPPGTVLASDDVLGAQVLRTKVQVGRDGTAQDVSNEHPMPVALAAAVPAGANAIGSVSVSALPALPAGGNAIGSVSVSALPALPAGGNAIGSVSVSALPALPAGGNAIGSVSVSSLPNVTVGAALPAGTNTVGNVRLTPATSGGDSVHRSISLVATGQLVKNAAGSLYGWHLANTNASAVWVKIYDKATAPTVGTDTPKMTIYLPATSVSTVCCAQGIAFTNGIGIGCTTGLADNNSTAPSASTVISNLFYA